MGALREANLAIQFMIHHSYPNLRLIFPRGPVTQVVAHMLHNSLHAKREDIIRVNIELPPHRVLRGGKYR